MPEKDSFAYKHEIVLLITLNELTSIKIGTLVLKTKFGPGAESSFLTVF